MRAGFIFAITLASCRPPTPEITSTPADPAEESTEKPEAQPNSPRKPENSVISVPPADLTPRCERTSSADDELASKCESTVISSFQVPESSESTAPECRVASRPGKMALVCARLSGGTETILREYDERGKYLWGTSLEGQRPVDVAYDATKRLIVLTESEDAGRIASRASYFSTSGEEIASHRFDWGVRTRLSSMSILSDHVFVSGNCLGQCDLPHPQGRGEGVAFVARVGVGEVSVDHVIDTDGADLGALVAARAKTAYWSVPYRKKARHGTRETTAQFPAPTCRVDVTGSVSGGSTGAYRAEILKLSRESDGAWLVDSSVPLQELKQVPFEIRWAGEKKLLSKISTPAAIIGVIDQGVVEVPSETSWPFRGSLVQGSLQLRRGTQVLWKTSSTPARLLDIHLDERNFALALELKDQRTLLTKYDISLGE